MRRHSPDLQGGENPLDPQRDAAPLDPEVLTELAAKLAFAVPSGQVNVTRSESASPVIGQDELRSFVSGQLAALGVTDPADQDEHLAATAAYLDRLIGRTGAGHWHASGVIGPDDIVALPTETEWEWAASRGWTARPIPFPWGESSDDTRCLVRDFTTPGDPRIVHFGGIPVGFFDIGAPPDRPQDMAGNVWDWTTSLALPWNGPADRDRPAGLAKHAVRGSSWFSREPMATHTSFRLDDPPCNAYWDLGFRIVVRTPPRSFDEAGVPPAADDFDRKATRKACRAVFTPGTARDDPRAGRLATGSWLKRCLLPKGQTA